MEGGDDGEGFAFHCKAGMEVWNWKITISSWHSGIHHQDS
jgi:hypothetical protein